MSRMTYKGYTARIEFDDRDDLFVGRLLGVNDIISFHADSVGGLHAAFQDAVEDYLADCAERGVEPEKPASGKIMLRIRPEVHAAAAIAAKASGKSLNQWAESVFERAARRRTGS
ncbi:type II toxin-antitoxin system HicB family antitoxin [Pseudomonas multiresinivorans]|uniref:Type II toxin-antitoxin system HicB family antitoxin n=1 Tax=Pseudomonas multiresinivorans TaxID=95301 RepID=A0A7Z3GN42_9PSED|nr:type II toxin-antitoxin system HicB family antitoxin [Pseudomonas multiresinivorans]QJP06585.1 type II toxin-antitoxin system HicB family antitoxin [Pseudomonas multiresinivorans]